MHQPIAMIRILAVAQTMVPGTMLRVMAGSLTKSTGVSPVADLSASILTAGQPVAIWDQD